MLGGVVAVLICVWFYRTADRLGLNPLPWIIGALIIYYGVKALWTYGLLKPLLGDAFTPRSMTAVLFIEISGALFGAVAAVLFRNRIMLKQSK